MTHSAWAYIKPEDREIYCRRLGNLTLLDKKLNERAGNVSFAEKRKIFAQSSIQMTKNLADLDEWTMQKIEDRQKTLAEVAVMAWNARPRS